MKRLLIATHNPAKKEEIRKFLEDVPVEFLSLDDVGITEDVAETGKSFEENAVLKATYYMKKSGLPTVSDDGGLEIDILGGEPGVYSKRWIGGNETRDEELVAYAIQRMEGVPAEKRGAQLRLVVAFVRPDSITHTTEAKVRGMVAEKPSDTPLKKGFPFRQILFIPEIGKYYNHEEMTNEEVLMYNHRRHALEKIKPYLLSFQTS